MVFLLLVLLPLKLHHIWLLMLALQLLMKRLNNRLVNISFPKYSKLLELRNVLAELKVALKKSSKQSWIVFKAHLRLNLRLESLALRSKIYHCLNLDAVCD